MRKRRITPPPKRAGVEDVSQDNHFGRERDYDPVRLPHERDESVSPESSASRPPPDAATEQAYKDVSGGQEDTDCRNSAAEITREADKKQST